VTGLKNPFDARYFIPVVSLLIGNMMEVNYKALSVYYMGLKYHNQLYYYLLGNGATHSEAVAYFVRRALEKVSIQNIANMSVIVVGLSPLVMWSMLLSGASVLAAVEYQILIMIATFCVSMISVVITLWVARHYSFDEYGQIKDAVQHIDVNQSL
jgi:putative ABC transport system permease protein